MNFPNTKLVQPKEVKVPIEKIKTIITNMDLDWWESHGGLSGAALDEFIDDLKTLKGEIR